MPLVYSRRRVARGRRRAAPKHLRAAPRRIALPAPRLDHDESVAAMRVLREARRLQRWPTQGDLYGWARELWDAGLAA